MRAALRGEAERRQPLALWQVACIAGVVVFLVALTGWQYITRDDRPPAPSIVVRPGQYNMRAELQKAYAAKNGAATATVAPH